MSYGLWVCALVIHYFLHCQQYCVKYCKFFLLQGAIMHLVARVKGERNRLVAVIVFTMAKINI